MPGRPDGSRNHSYSVFKKKIIRTPTPITVLQIIQTIILKINEESEYQVRPISFFLIIQKSVKNRTKNSLKKLTFTVLHSMRHILKVFFVSSKLLHFYLPSCTQTAKKSYFFFRKGYRLPTCLPYAVKASHCPLYC